VASWVDSYLLPPPADVFDKFQVVLKNGTLWMHIRATMLEALLGLGAGVGIGMALGYLIARIAMLEDLLSPVIVAFQSTPVVAYAPLLVIWFGSGAESKIITSALVVFFPMLMNTLVGVRNVPGNLRDLMRVSGASYWQTLTRLEIPAAMPVLLTGLKTSATLAMIGAVVGEFIVARKGLGFMVNQGRFNFDTPQVYVAVITMALITSAMYALLTLIERRMLRWQRRGR
jgi:NitT/TauT family transport system permease protein